MAKKKLSVPVWAKLVLAFLLLIVILCGTCVAVVNIQYYTAEENKVLPQINGYRYCAVTGGDLNEKYQDSSLLIVEKIRRYWTGDEVIVLNRDITDPELVFNRRYLLVRIVDADDEELTGEFIARSGETVTFAQYEVIGKVSYIIPVLGLIYDLMLGLPGILLFLLVPIILTIVWIIVIVGMHSRRLANAELCEDEPEEEDIREIQEELFGDETRLEKEPRLRKSKQTHESFDLFGEEPNELEYLKESPFVHKPPEYAFSQPSNPHPDQPLEETPAAGAAPLMDPRGKRAAMQLPAENTIEPDAPLNPAIIPEAVPLPPAPPTVAPEPNPLPDVLQPDPPYMQQSSPDEAVAIYQEDSEALRRFEPDYLNRNIGESLEQLRQSLQTVKRPGSEVDIVIGDQPAGLDKEKQRRLDQINSFDPDKAIAEIKRKNALYESNLPKQNDASSVSESNPSAVKRDGAYPSRSANEFYRIHGGENLSLDEVAKLHRKDFDERKFRPSYIAVVGEEENNFPSENSRFRNRNESDE